MEKRTVENVLTKIFHYIALVLFFTLFINGMFGTGKEQIIGTPSEFVLWQQDSFWWNAVKLLVATGVLFLAGKIYDRLIYKIHPNILLAAVCVFVGIFSIWWVTAAPNYPVADQFTICDYAMAFNHDNYEGIQKISYLTVYPQQLGIVTLLRILFSWFGDMNYRAFQYFSALLVPVLVLSGCMIVRHLTNKNRKAEFFYLLFALCCAPMYLYVPYVYGDLPSTALGLLATWLLLSCLEKFSVPKVVGLALTVGLMVQLRKNTLILVIAFVIVAFVRLLGKFKWQVLVTGCSVIAGVLLLQGALNLTYAGVRDTSLKGIPASLYLVMGTNDKDGNPGWYNAYALDSFTQNGCNPKIATEKAMVDYRARLREFAENPGYALDFYQRKMNYQWNSPMYQSRIMNFRFNGELKPLAVSVYGGPKMDVLLQGFMKIYQLLMYGSILFLLFADRKGLKNVEKYVLLIAVFGGFVFSMLWEAKPRYVMPYFLMLVPMYAVAVEYLLKKTKSGAKAIRYLVKSVISRDKRADKKDTEKSVENS